jgi:hypothetical protein
MKNVLLLFLMTGCTILVWLILSSRPATLTINLDNPLTCRDIEHQLLKQFYAKSTPPTVVLVRGKAIVLSETMPLDINHMAIGRGVVINQKLAQQIRAKQEAFFERVRNVCATQTH